METFYNLNKDRLWFKRTWIIQEVVASAKELVIFSVRHQVKLADLARLYYVLIREATPIATSIQGRDSSLIQRLDQIRNGFKLAKAEDGSRVLTLQHGPFALLRSADGGGISEQKPSYEGIATFFTMLLTYLNGSTATDSRDQIYGMLALIKVAGNLPSHFDADYRLEYEYIFHRYGAFLIEGTGNLDLLKYRKHELTGVPTWVPDFRYIWANPFAP